MGWDHGYASVRYSPGSTHGTSSLAFGKYSSHFAFGDYPVDAAQLTQHERAVGQEEQRRAPRPFAHFRFSIVLLARKCRPSDMDAHL